MIVTLTVTEGPHQGQAFEFREHDTFIVGRSKDAHFRLPIKDKTLSRFHFMVEVNPPCCRLMDMASRNGTLVNGLKVSVVDLKDGDTIEGGRSVLAVSIQRDPAAARVFAEIDSTRPAVPRPAASGSATTVDVPGADWSVPDSALEQVLGEGGMGIVYGLAASRTEPSSRSRRSPRRSWGPKGRSRDFSAKRACLRQLDHPNIVKFERLGHAGGRLFFAMEYVAGPRCRCSAQETRQAVVRRVGRRPRLPGARCSRLRPRPRLCPSRHQADKRLGGSQGQPAQGQAD